MFDDGSEIPIEVELNSEAGYLPLDTLERAKQFDALRGEPGFVELIEQAREGREQALRVFREGGGERLLGR